MVFWALDETGRPTSGQEAIRRREEGEEHSYTSVEFPGLEVIQRAGVKDSLLAPYRRDHFFLKTARDSGVERRSDAEVGRIGVEAILRESGDMYEVGRGHLFKEWDSSEYSHKPQTSLDTGFDVVYARQTREGKSPIDYVVMVFKEPPNSRDYWKVVEACFKSGPKNGMEKYVVRTDGSKTEALGTGKSTKQRNGKLYVATVLIGDPDNWARGDGSFVNDILAKTEMPLNFYDLGEGAMTSVGGKVNGSDMRKERTFSLAAKDFDRSSFVVGTRPGHPKSTERVGLAYFVDQEQTSLFTGMEGDQGRLF